MEHNLKFSAPKLVDKYRDAHAGGTGGAAAPSAFIYERQEGQELRFILNSSISPIFEGVFSVVDSFVQEIFLETSPQTPKLTWHY